MRRRGSYAAGRARREQILETATLHFARNGYYATSLSDIARDLEISIGGLMHHFPTKQDLLAALADRRISLLIQYAGDEPSEDYLWFWRSRVEMAQRMVEKPGLIELFVVVAFVGADPASPVHERYRTRYEGAAEYGARFYRQGVESGLFRPDIDCVGLARQGMAITDGFQLQWALSHGGIDLPAVIKEFFEQQLSLIVTPGHEIDLTPRPKTRRKVGGPQPVGGPNPKTESAKP